MFINYDDIIIEIDRSMWLGLDNSGHVSFKVIKRWDSPKDCYQDLFIRYISQYLREILEQSVNYMTLTRRVSIFEPIEDCFDKLQNMVWAFKYAMYIKSFSTFHGMIQKSCDSKDYLASYIAMILWAVNDDRFQNQAFHIKRQSKHRSKSDENSMGMLNSTNILNLMSYLDSMYCYCLNSESIEKASFICSGSY